MHQEHRFGANVRSDALAAVKAGRTGGVGGGHVPLMKMARGAVVRGMTRGEPANSE